MQPSTSFGRKARLALLPFSWGITFATVTGVFKILACVRGSSITQILRADTLWPLVFILPALFFGKVLGLIVMNLIAYLTPLRQVFERECRDTGRQGIVTATIGLARVAFVFSVLTLAGMVVFLLFSR